MGTITYINLRHYGYVSPAVACCSGSNSYGSITASAGGEGPRQQDQICTGSGDCKDHLNGGSVGGGEFSSLLMIRGRWNRLQWLASWLPGNQVLVSQIVQVEPVHSTGETAFEPCIKHIARDKCKISPISGSVNYTRECKNIPKNITMF